MLWLSAAIAGTCTQSTVPEVALIPAPAVLVLGERMGTAPDLPRATRLVRKLAAREPVTLGLQIVPSSKQQVLTRYDQGELAPELLEQELGWKGFPFAPYARLLSLDVDTLALGVPVEAKPEGQPVPLPRAYGRFLADGMSGHPMPADLEAEFAQMVAWVDLRIALNAIESWDGQGYLVIVADRTHVEGGNGIGWQAQRLTEAPVHTVLLGDAGACYDGDTYL